MKKKLTQKECLDKAVEALETKWKNKPIKKVKPDHPYTSVERFNASEEKMQFEMDSKGSEHERRLYAK